MLAQPTQQLPAVYAGQHHIEHDDPGSEFAGQRKRLCGVASAHERVAGAGQVALEEVQGIRIVIDHQHRCLLGDGQRQDGLEGLGSGFIGHDRQDSS